MGSSIHQIKDLGWIQELFETSQELYPLIVSTFRINKDQKWTGTRRGACGFPETYQKKLKVKKRCQCLCCLQLNERFSKKYFVKIHKSLLHTFSTTTLRKKGHVALNMNKNTIYKSRNPENLHYFSLQLCNVLHLFFIALFV